MSLLLGFTTSAVMGVSVATQAFLADLVAQVWEVRILDKPRSPDDCCACNCNRTFRFAFMPGLLQGLVEGFVNGMLWDDYYLGKAAWPSQYLLATAINDCIVTFVVYPLSYVIHKQPAEGNLIPAVGAAMLLRVIVQLICGFTKASFFLSDFLGSWLPLCIFSHMMYRHSEMVEAIAEGSDDLHTNGEFQNEGDKEPAKVDAEKAPENSEKVETDNAPEKVENKDAGNPADKAANASDKIDEAGADKTLEEFEKAEAEKAPEKDEREDVNRDAEKVEKADADKEQAPEAKADP